MSKEIETKLPVAATTPCSAGLDAAIHEAARVIIGGFAANGRRNPDWIAEAERIIRREIAPPIREALAPMLLNPASPSVKRIWPAAVKRAAALLDSLPNADSHSTALTDAQPKQ